MSLPGLQELQQISPAFAAVAQRLGESAWTTASRTPRETTACFLACDLLHGLFGLPLRLHITMAQRLGVTDGYIRQVLVLLAPAAGYPQVAEALASSNALLSDPADRSRSDRVGGILLRPAVAGPGHRRRIRLSRTRGSSLIDGSDTRCRVLLGPCHKSPGCLVCGMNRIQPGR
jgi:hypothetical protein